MAFQTRDVVEAMERAGAPPITELKVDGGASAMRLLLELQANQLGIPVTRSATTESTAVGAAYLAGLAEGVWSSTAELREMWSGDVTVEPTTDRKLAETSYLRWLEAVERSLTRTTE
jgi:glycerol kinase